MIDIVLATCDRLDCLKATLGSIWRNTRTDYRLHVIDDASTEGNQAWLREQSQMGKIDSLLERPKRLGVAANLREIHRLTKSGLVVYCDDDQLCPNVEPDWLTRLVTAMGARPKQGILSLNNPHGNVGSDKRHKTGTDGVVTFCKRSGGSFACFRRHLLPKLAPPDGTKAAVSYMYARAQELGYRTGYLTHTYCYHIGVHSVRANRNLSREIALIKPVNMETLEPPEKYRG